MSNSRINLSDLKASNINQLGEAEMLMVLGGCDRGRRNNYCGRDSYFNKTRSGEKVTVVQSTCSGNKTTVPAPVSVPAVVDFER